MSSMRMRCHLAFNGKAVEANIGETLIDAALGGSMLIPQDCRSGQCQSCRVTVVSGSVDDRGTAYGRTVLACQATVSGDVEDRVRGVADAGEAHGHHHRDQLARRLEIVEVVMTTTVPLEFRPGQYVRLKLSGFPAREFSPTCRLDGSSKDTRARLSHQALAGRARVARARPRDQARARRACAGALRPGLSSRGRRAAHPDLGWGRLGAHLGLGADRRAAISASASSSSSPAAATPTTSTCVLPSNGSWMTACAK